MAKVKYFNPLITGIVIILILLRHPAPAQETVSKLADILENPKSFLDKSVLLQGIFAQRNCNHCFMYKEGADTIKIRPQGFDSPDYKPGTRIRIRGIVRTEKGAAVIDAQEVSKLP